MEEVFKNLSNFNLWGDIKHTPNETCDVTELWLDHASNTIKPKERRIFAAELDNWLGTFTEDKPAGKRTLVARFVWVDFIHAETDNTVDLSSSVEKILLNSFGVEPALNYSRSCVTGITALPATSTPLADQRAYSFSYAPKLAAVWSHNRFRPPHARESVTEGLIIGQKKQIDTLKVFFKGASWRPEVTQLAMFPAFLIGVLLDKEVNDTQQGIKMELRKIETRTGYHNFESRKNTPPSTGVLLESLRNTNGHATRLASTQRKSKTLEKLLAFIERMVGEDDARRHNGNVQQTGQKGGYELMKHHANVLKDRLDMQIIDSDYTSKRIDTQISALNNIITQKDNEFSLDLNAKTADIAEYSYRDSSSMKTLAIVTMFFLPGSFISALFSTPCFDWDRVDLRVRDNIGVTPTPQFALYWVITVPLTVLTFVLYFWWLKLQKKKQKERLNKHEDDKKNLKHLNDFEMAPLEPESQQILKAYTRRETRNFIRANS